MIRRYYEFKLIVPVEIAPDGSQQAWRQIVGALEVSGYPEIRTTFVDVFDIEEKDTEEL